MKPVNPNDEPKDKIHAPAYRATLLRRGEVYVTDAGQEFKGDGRRFGVFCDGLIVTTPKPDEPNKDMPMPIIYSNRVYATREIELLIERDAQRREDLREWQTERLRGLDRTPGVQSQGNG